jgi:hypothetical protein
MSHCIDGTTVPSFIYRMPVFGLRLWKRNFDSSIPSHVGLIANKQDLRKTEAQSLQTV